MAEAFLLSMSSLRSLASLSVLFVSVLGLRAAPPIARLLPEDAAIVVAFPDVPALAAAAEKAPFLQMWNDPQIQRFFAPMRESSKWDETLATFKTRTGYTVQELVGLATGEAVFVLTDFAFATNPETQARPPVLMAVDFGENASKIEKLIEESTQRQKADGKVEEETESFAGTTLHTLVSIVEKTSEKTDDAEEKNASKMTPFTLHWASTDGLLVASSSKQAIAAFLDAVQKGGVDSPLERSPRYVNLQEKTGAHLFSLLMHFPSIVSSVEKTLVGKSANEKANPMGVNPAALIGALGFDTWQDFYVTAQIDASSSVTHYGLTFTEERGLLKIFRMAEAAFPRPEWIPAKWDSVTTARFSLKDMFAGLEETMRAVSPPLEGMAQGYLAQIGKQLNADIKRDFFGSFGNEVVQGQFFAAAGSGAAPNLMESEQFYAFSVENAAAILRVIDGFKRLGGPAIDKMLEGRDYLGQKIYAFTPPAGPDGTRAPGAKGFAYALTDRYFLLNVGSAAPVEAVLQSMANRGESFWDKPEIKRALATVPEDATSFASQNVAVLIAASFEWLASLPAAPASDPAEKKAERSPFAVDAKEKPSLELIERYWGENIGWTRRDANGIYGVSRLTHPQP